MDTRRRRILAVDDEISITRLLRLTLQRAGPYEVREENSAVSVMAVARLFQPHLILMDVMMPEMSGGDVAALLRQDPALRRIPIIFLTAAVRREELGGAAAKIGGRYYVAKPLQAREIVELIERTLENSFPVPPDRPEPQSTGVLEAGSVPTGGTP